MNRLEKDLLGQREVPESKFWGIHTLRAIENFSISGQRVNLDLWRALAAVKEACAYTNAQLGFLPKEKASALEQAARELREDLFPIPSGVSRETFYADLFPIDALQGGAGTSTNMCLNEVLASRAAELLGGKRGDWNLVHPIEHVNLHQSTNDVFPTAVKLAAIWKFRRLAESAAKLQDALQKKEKEFATIVKIGRTEMQEAVPMTLGQEFAGFAEAVSRDRWRTFKCEERLRVVNLGGTAVGTGLTAPRDYIFRATEKLRELTGIGLSRGDNPVGETANADTLVEVSGILKAHASTLLKLANDLRMLNLLREIRLPQLQAGSSIMPGKVNPVLCEFTMQIGMKVLANDALLADAVSRSTFQIVEFLPLASHTLFESLDLLTALDVKLARHIEEIEPDGHVCSRIASESLSIVTALVPKIGYEAATKLVSEFKASGATDFRLFLSEHLDPQTVTEWLAPHRLTQLGYRPEKVPARSGKEEEGKK